MQAVLEGAEKQMTDAKIVAVKIAGDGVFVEFADGLGSFFAGDFLESHRDSKPNQLFVAGNDAAGTGSDLFARSFPANQDSQPLRPLLM